MQSSPPSSSSRPVRGTVDLDEALNDVERALTHLARLARPSRIFGEITDTLGRPIDRSAYGVLARIEEFGPIRLTDLAAAMEIDISTASRHVRSLEDRGLLQRSEEPGDQRARRLELTDAGEAVLGTSRRQRLSGIEKRLRDWGARDTSELARLLTRLAESFSAPLGAVEQACAAEALMASAGEKR